MIAVSVTVFCDSPDCEAEFIHEPAVSVQFADVQSGVDRQLQGRGWRSEDGRHLCPLHQATDTTGVAS